MKYIESWGKYPKTKSEVRYVFSRHDTLPSLENTAILPYGLGRTYGDGCLNDDNVILLTRGLNKYIEFDRVSGVLKCEAGVSFDEILKLVVPEGWFLPVTPGTKFVTVGGAIANDVHGKNHHVNGTFSNHVNCFELLRSDGTRMLCSPDENNDFYDATIGGLGLTGLITWAEIQLKKIQSAYIEMESFKVRNLDEFIEVAEASDKEFEYTVSWLDCLASGDSLGKGIFMRGNHSAEGLLKPHKDPKLKAPFDAPNFALNSLSIKAFNFLYYNKQISKEKSALVHYDPFFYPLDAVDDWNRIYGNRGFFQYQFVLPFSDKQEGVRAILKKISDSGQGSFLGVVKNFGDVKSPGMLSFPMPGVSVALDFANKGESTLHLFKELDAIVRDQGGRVYPAKDACMSGQDFQHYYPQWENFQRFVDAKFSSSFWRRVMEEIRFKKTT